MQDAMFAALDPYHRIRAIVAAVFVLVVTGLVIASMSAPRHEGASAVSAGAAVSAAPAAPAVSSGATRAP